MEYSKEDIINFLKEWRSSNSYTTNADGSLTEQSLARFMEGLNERANKLSYHPGSAFIAGFSTSVIFQMRFAEPINDSGEDITTFSDFSLPMLLVYL